MGGLLIALALCVSDDAQKAAGAHFDRGVALAARGDYAASLAEFQEAYRLAPAWQVLFNLGVVREKLGEPTQALEAFDAYLAQGGAAIPRATLQQVEQELKVLRTQVAELAVKVDGGPATVEVDGQERGPGPTYVLPGRHRVSAHAGGRTAQADVEAHKGDRVVVALVLADVGPPPPTVVVEAAPLPANADALAPRASVQANSPPVALTPAIPVTQPEPALAARPPELEAPKPWHQRWYVWTAIGAVVVAGVVTSIAVVETRRSAYDLRIDTP
jgi:hypothetical protein